MQCTMTIIHRADDYVERMKLRIQQNFWQNNVCMYVEIKIILQQSKNKHVQIC